MIDSRSTLTRIGGTVDNEIEISHLGVEHHSVVFPHIQNGTIDDSLRNECTGTKLGR